MESNLVRGGLHLHGLGFGFFASCLRPLRIQKSNSGVLVACVERTLGLLFGNVLPFANGLFVRFRRCDIKPLRFKGVAVEFFIFGKTRENISL